MRDASRIIVPALARRKPVTIVNIGIFIVREHAFGPCGDFVTRFRCELRKVILKLQIVTIEAATSNCRVELADQVA
jgi:hypothetical protein